MKEALETVFTLSLEPPYYNHYSSSVHPELMAVLNTI